MTPKTKGYDYPFPYLVDEPDEGRIDTHGWLPGDAASTREEAVEEFTRRYVDVCGDAWWKEHDPPLVLVCVGREYLRAEYHDFRDGDGAELVLLGVRAEARAAEKGHPEELRFVQANERQNGAAAWWELRLERGA